MRSLGAPLISFVAALSIGACTTATQACQPTSPNGSTPPAESPDPNYFGNGQLWTAFWPEGTVLFEPGGPSYIGSDGTLAMKFPWWRGEGVVGKLEIKGRRLDGHAPPLRAEILEDYGDTGFQSSSLIFPTAGCWEVTGHAGDAELTFVTRVVGSEGQE